jgi:hypothetical protein
MDHGSLSLSLGLERSDSMQLMAACSSILRSMRDGRVETTGNGDVLAITSALRSSQVVTDN